LGGCNGRCDLVTFGSARPDPQSRAMSSRALEVWAWSIVIALGAITTLIVIAWSGR
jgi:hypothetical protein